jgi:hypothetical protein
VIEVVVSESASLTDNIDYNFLHAALAHPFKANMNQELYQNRYLIRDYVSTFTGN